MKVPSGVGRVAALAISLMLAAGCGSPDIKKRHHLKNGEEALAQGRTNDALVEFRTAVSIDPSFAEAHIKVAEVLAGLGDAPGALQHYIRAADLRPEDDDLQINTGTLLMAVGRVSDAKARAESVLKRNPKNVDAHVLLGNALGGLQDLNSALNQIQEALNLDEQRATSQVQLGVVQQVRGDLGAAEAAFQQAVTLSPNWVGGYLALANFYMATGRLAPAMEAVDRALEQDPKHEGANRAKAMLLFVAGKPKEAERFLRQIAESNSGVAPKLSLADYYLAVGNFAEAIRELTPLASDPRTATAAAPRLARAHASRGDYSAARQVIQQILSANPQNAVAHVLESQLLLSEGRRAEAVERARVAVDIDPRLTIAQYALGKAYAAIGDTGAAETSFKEVLKLNPQATPALLELSSLKLGTRPGDSLQFSRAAISQRPGDLNARMMLVRGLISSGDLERAARELSQLQSVQKTAAGYTQAGVIATLRNQSAEARSAFEAALQLEPESVEAFAGIVALEIKNGDFTAAKKRVKARLERSSSSELLMVAARSYIATGDLSDSEAVLRRAIAQEPGSLPAYSMLAQLFVRQGKLDEARREFDQIAERESRPVGALTMAGTILMAQGDSAGATTRFERAVSIDKVSSAVAANNLAWIYADSGQNPSRAVTLAQSALQQLPDMPDVLDTLGWAYVKSNLPELAVSPLTRCVKLDGKNGACHHHLGLAFSALKREADAKLHLQAAISLKGPWVSDAQRALDMIGSSSRQ